MWKIFRQLFLLIINNFNINFLEVIFLHRANLKIFLHRASLKISEYIFPKGWKNNQFSYKYFEELINMVNRFRLKGQLFLFFINNFNIYIFEVIFYIQQILRSEVFILFILDIVSERMGNRFTYVGYIEIEKQNLAPEFKASPLLISVYIYIYIYILFLASIYTYTPCSAGWCIQICTHGHYMTL